MEVTESLMKTQPLIEQAINWNEYEATCDTPTGHCTSRFRSNYGNEDRKRKLEYRMPC